MRDLPITQRQNQVSSSRIAVQGADTGAADLSANMAALTRQKRDEIQNQAYENAYLQGQADLENAVFEIEQKHVNNPQAMQEALKEYRESFLSDISDPNMQARFDLQLEKSSNTAVARATSGRNRVINDQSRFENLQAFEGLQQQVRRISGDLASADPLVAETAKQQLQEITSRAQLIMGQSDTDGMPLFGASTRFDQLANLSDMALEGAAMQYIMTHEDPEAALQEWRSGSMSLQMPNGEGAGNLEQVSLNDVFEKGLIQQESGGNQTDDQGNPLTSSAGAIGIAQVMPATGPEAAKLAGLPWDEQRYKTDKAYNKALGKAYFAQQVKTFDGNVTLGLMAYNAGPGAVRKYLKEIGDPTKGEISTEQFVQQFPFKETRDYVNKIGDRLGITTVDIKNSVSETTARTIENAAETQISNRNAMFKKQREFISSQLDLAIETAEDDPQPNPNAVGPQVPVQTKSQKLSRVLQEIDTNPLYNATPEGVIKGNDLREKVFKKLKDEREKIDSVANGTAFAGGQKFLNRQDKEAVQAFDDYYESIEPNLAQLSPGERNVAMAQLINNSKVVPKRLKGDIQRIARSQDIEQIKNAADFLDRVTDVNPHMINDLAPAKDIARIDMVNDRIDRGYTAQEALKMVDEQLDPRNELTLAAATAELKDKKIDYRGKAVQAFDSAGFFKELVTFGQGDGLDPDSVTQKPIIDGLAGTYRMAYEDHYKITRDTDAAEKYAQRIVKGRYGVTRVNGDNHVMQDPPEKFYSIPGFDDEWMREQMIDDAQKYFKNTFVENSEKYGRKDLKKNLILVSDVRTRREVEAGAPSYMLAYKNADGTLQKVGTRFVFDPDAVRSKAVEEARSKVESYQRVQAAKEQYGNASLQSSLVQDREMALRVGDTGRAQRIDGQLNKLGVKTLKVGE